MHWLEMSLEAGLSQLPWATLLNDMGNHLIESALHREREPWRIRPSLISDPCPLSQAKKMLGHEPQPGVHFDSVRMGRPNGGTAMNFIRGFSAEGLVVSCLKRTGYGRVLAAAPSYELRVDPDLEAHPDVLMDGADGENEPFLVQVKNPNHGMFERITKGGDTGIVTRYLPQVALEIYIARAAGLMINKAYLFLLTWDPWPASVTLQSGLQTFVKEIWWTPEAEGLVNELIANLRTIRENAYNGQMPEPHPAEANKYPHLYCGYSRHGDGTVPACTDHAAWAKATAA
jgi:hypothetical protein